MNSARTSQSMFAANLTGAEPNQSNKADPIEEENKSESLGTGERNKERDVEMLEFGSTDSEPDDLDIALKRVRDIPLEQYLSQERAN